MGTGTSQGVPVIGCTCPVCSSEDPRDQRLRTAAFVQAGPLNLAIDCGPDFRAQMLKIRATHLDGLLVTHEHNDHVIGMDDIRPFNFMSKQKLPVYATPPVQAELRRRFPYVFEEKNRYPGAPTVELRSMDKHTPFHIQNLEIVPIEVLHGSLPVLGFRFGRFAYITDMRTIADEEAAKLDGLEVLVLNALHFQEHYTHLNVEQALAFIERIGPRRAYLTHISHRMGKHAEVNAMLPEHVSLGYDGLVIRMTD